MDMSQNRVDHLGNYLRTENPFKLADPPAWWLQEVYDYDSQLVVFPSRHRMAFILARRRHFSNAMVELDYLDKKLVAESAGLDGDILAKHNLIYVRHLIGETTRRHGLVQWLRDHDTVANGGGEKVAQRLEDAELDIEQQKRRTMISDIDHRARDAYRSYKARTGQRVGYGDKAAKPSARQMPLTGFTPKESSVAIFTR
jgi:hypothetical protein